MEKISVTIRVLASLLIVVLGVILVYVAMEGGVCNFSGNYSSYEYYGGDAYTGIQHAVADTSRNVNNLGHAMENGVRTLLQAGGFVIAAFGLYLFGAAIKPSVNTDALLELRRTMQSASPVPMAGVSAERKQEGATGSSFTAAMEEEYALRWQEAKVTQGVRIDRCPMCGKKKQELVHAEFNDFFGKAEYDICFSCFLARKATPKKK